MANRFSSIRTLRGWLYPMLHRKRCSIQPGLTLGLGASIRLGRSGTVSFGHDLKVKDRVTIDTQNGTIRIGDRCSLNLNVILYGIGGIEIGDDVRIAANTVIVSSNHVFDDPDKTIRSQGNSEQGIRIGNDVWIGANCTVLDGSHIADGCVIAAGSVVRGKTEPYGVYGGVPIRLLKSRA